MSAYLTIDGKEPTDLASNVGWGSVCEWIDGLDSNAYPDLVHLREHGWSEPASAVREQLAAAMQDSPAEGHAADVIANLLETLAGLGDESLGVTS